MIEPVQSGLGESGRKRGLFTLGVLDGVSGGIGAARWRPSRRSRRRSRRRRWRARRARRHWKPPGLRQTRGEERRRATRKLSNSCMSWLGPLVRTTLTKRRSASVVWGYHADLLVERRWAKTYSLKIPTGLWTEAGHLRSSSIPDEEEERE